MPIDSWLPPYDDVETMEPKLFNLVDDPSERYDLSKQYPEKVQSLKQDYDKWFESIFADWQESFEEIKEHDKAYWEDKTPPDPRKLFKGHWPWDKVDANPEEDDPLEVFKGYWNPGKPE